MTRWTWPRIYICNRCTADWMLGEARGSYRCECGGQLVRGDGLRREGRPVTRQRATSRCADCGRTVTLTVSLRGLRLYDFYPDQPHCCEGARPTGSVEQVNP